MNSLLRPFTSLVKEDVYQYPWKKIAICNFEIC